jgi:hypothetical protein
MYVVVFACDLLLSIGLIVLALEHVITEQGMLANLDKGASQRPNLLTPTAVPSHPSHGRST